VMPALVAGIHVLSLEKQTSWPGHDAPGK